MQGRQVHETSTTKPKMMSMKPKNYTSRGVGAEAASLGFGASEVAVEQFWPAISPVFEVCAYAATR